MKLQTIAAALLLIVPAIAVSQTPTRDRRTTETDQPAQPEANTGRDRVVGPKVSNHVDAQKRTETTSDTEAATQNPDQNSPAWGNTAFIVRPSTVSQSSSPKPGTSPGGAGAQQSARKLVQPTSLINAPVRPAAARMPVTSIYNVGVGDVLDVRVANVPTKESTLFTVMKNGTLEYPLLSGPLSVAGLSTDEIARLLSAQIQVIKAARITVSVRDYASHAYVIGGLVDAPGRKILRREAMPLFAALAEALVRPEATTATILRNGNEGDALFLKDEQAMATLVMSGDVIKISGAPLAPGKFVYVGGQVTSPGEKTFREGMTLTQALLSAGGTLAAGKTIRIARRNAGGYLSTNEYNLRSIEQGKAPDPLLEAGDRIEVSGSM
jgi:protein involved in polysaccharide export with SLBB domain